jgi:predicted RecB family nuclease
VYLDGKPQLKVGITELDLPTFDIEIDIDLENFNGAIQEFDLDASLGPDRLYLYGYITHDRTSHANWDASPRGSFEDYSGTREGEHSIYLSMWNYLHEQIAAAKAAGHSIGIFHYSQHEVTWWGKWPSNFQDLPGTPTLGEVQAFVSQYLVDMYPIAKRVVFPSSKKLPICDYSIKTLAPLADFEWSVQDAGGAMSLLKYEEATSSDLSKSTKAQGWLRDYNIDDVRATMAVRNWIRKLDL